MVRTTLGALTPRHDDSKSVNDLREFLYCKMAGGKETYEAVARAEALGAAASVVETLKTASPAAQAAMLTTPYSQALSRLIANHSARGAFSTMSPFMTQVPLRTRLIVSSAVITASEVGEGQAKPVRRLNLAELDTEVSKFAATIAMSKEFLDAAPEMAERVLADSLAEAVSRAVDGYFLSKLAAINSNEFDTDAAPSWTQMVADLEELLRLLRTGQNSKLFFILTPRELKALSAAAYTNGIGTVKYSGGEIMGVGLVPSDSQTSGVVTAVDASAIVYGTDGIEVRTSDVAALQLQDDPTNASATSVAATTLTSCFATNTRALIAEQRVSVRVADTLAVASLTGLTWGAGEGSPQGF